MKPFLPILLLTFAGCNNSASPVIPPTTGDFVKNQSGVGTAEVFGIEFRVKVNSRGARTEDRIHANFVDPEQSSARKRFTFGDEITIQLDSINEAEVSFLLNDQDFGTLNVGDKVVIDEERNVEVNGTARLPSDSP
jgi:hypothetical protein